MNAQGLPILVTTMVLAMAGCSSVSMPSMPSLSPGSWFGSSTPVDPTAEALFDEGMRYYNDKKYVRAIDAFNKVKTDFPFSPNLAQAELKAADAYYLNQQYPEAINAFKEFQSLHPSNENIPFVTYRLGQAHFDQFTSTDRDQKNTEIAKGYFETVLTKYPKSPHAAGAKEKLAKCVEYLSEHDFNVAAFYLHQEKYPAARDRFEEIVRRYPGTPASVKSLFYLGESYRREGNNVKAALAYEALIQHYPQSQFVGEAKTQLAKIEKEKNDPLAMLLMRDRRSAPAPAPEKPDSAIAKLKDVELIAKKEVVYEEPGGDKSVFRRVLDTLNPFSENGNKSEEKAPESWQEMLAKKKAAEKKEESPGFMASFWGGINPFSNGAPKDKKPNGGTGNGQLVDQIDDSLKGKGIDAETQVAALKAPAAALPASATQPAPPAPTMDPEKLLGAIDSNLKKNGTEVKELTPPKAAEGFNNPAVLEAVAAKQKSASQPDTQKSDTSGLLSSIDQKLKKQGVQPAGFQPAPAAPVASSEAPVKKESPKKVEIEPKVALEKGPLFLKPEETQGITATTPDSPSSEQKPESKDAQTPTAEFTKTLVKGPAQSPQTAPAKKPEEKKSSPEGINPENPGVFDQLKQDMDSIGKLLNPFRW